MTPDAAVTDMEAGLDDYLTQVSADGIRDWSTRARASCSMDGHSSFITFTSDERVALCGRCGEPVRLVEDVVPTI